MKKKYIFGMFFLAILATFVYAITDGSGNEVLLQTPLDGAYDTDGNVNFTALVKAGSGRNVSNVSLWTNFSGTWAINTTNSTFVDLAAEGNAFFDVGFRPDNIADGTHILWNVEIVTNDTAGNTNRTYALPIGSNRTLKVEYAPPAASLSFNYPGALFNVSANTFDVNASASTIYTPSSTDTLTCDVFTNTSVGDKNTTRLLYRAAITNGTSLNFTAGLEEGENMRLTMKCWETGRDAVFNYVATNLTLDVDRTAPVIAQNLSDAFDSDGTVELNYTVTELNGQGCVSELNGVENKTTGAYSNGALLNFTYDSLNDGNYSFTLYCWDFAGNNATVSNQSITIDSVGSNIEGVVNTTQNALRTIQIYFTTNELTIANISHGITTLNHENRDLQIGSEYRYNHSYNITVNETQYHYYNITTCDRANNCNLSAQYTISNMSSIYAGWNAYGLFGPSTLGALFNSSGGDFAYWWNGTGQSWTSHTSGIGTHADLTIAGGDVVWIFKSTNSSWARPVWSAPIEASTWYQVNLTSGTSFVNAQQEYHFFNLSASFTNATTRPWAGNSILTGNLIGGLAFNDGSGDQDIDITNIDFYAYYDNQNQTYVNYFRNDSFNNFSIVPRGTAVFVGTTHNVTWNGTAITGNWTMTS